MRKILTLIGAFFFFLSVHANKKIVVTISPIYSLVKNVSGNLNDVQLLISPNVSPHDYQPKPSDIKKLRSADIVFIIDEHFEAFINAKNVDKEKLVSLIESPGLKLLHTRHEKDAHDHGHHHGDDSHNDLHFWGSPYNAKMAVKAISAHLSQIDPENQKAYSDNADRTLSKIDAMDKKIRQMLDQVKAQPFLVFHDGYQYFENYYGLRNVGSVTSGHNTMYGAKTLQKIINTVKDTNAKCIFAEPQFSENIVEKVSKVTGVKIGYLDIEGSGIGRPKDLPAEEIFFFMMEQNAQNFKNCFEIE